MRITGGNARGISLAVPPGNAVRPATDAMRQAVFSSLASWVGGLTFVDLFAGSGAYGLEALSRGAVGGTFVEKDPRTVRCLRANVAAVCRSLGRTDEGVHVVEGDALSWNSGTRPPQIAFVDPPYPVIAELAPVVFARLSAVLATEADPLIVFEMPGELTLRPEGWTCVKRFGKGDRQPTVAIFRADRALRPPASAPQ